MQDTWVRSLCQEDLLEKRVATHSSFLAWRIPWAEEPGRLQSMRSQKVIYKKDRNDPDNHNDVISQLEPDILECEVKWTLGSVTTNKVSGGDGIPVELFHILKDDAMKALHSICHQIWKTQQWP